MNFKTVKNLLEYCGFDMITEKCAAWVSRIKIWGIIVTIFVFRLILHYTIKANNFDKITTALFTTKYWYPLDQVRQQRQRRRYPQRLPRLQRQRPRPPPRPSAMPIGTMTSIAMTSTIVQNVNTIKEIAAIGNFF